MRWIIAIAGIPIVVAISWLLARYGEPQSVRLWRDVFGFF